MVARKNQNIVRIIRIDIRYVLVNCIRCTGIPVRALLRLIRLENGDTATVTVEIPWNTDADVCIKTKRLILGQYTDGINTRVNAVRRGKSIILYFPPNDTAGFATFFVRTPRREPWPPAKSMAIISFLITSSPHVQLAVWKVFDMYSIPRNYFSVNPA